MRHRRAHRQLGRAGDQRDAILRSIVTGVITHGRIETTATRAKEAKPVLEKLITSARGGDIAAMRLARRALGNQPAVIKRLFEVVAPQYKERPGGYARIIRSGVRRGDSAPVALLELVDFSK